MRTLVVDELKQRAMVIWDACSKHVGGAETAGW